MKKQKAGVVLLALCAHAAVVAAPCAGIEESNAAFPDAEKGIARQLRDAKQNRLPDVQKVAVLQMLKKNEWQILYVETGVSDRLFLFYPGDPQSNAFITVWSGAARKDETKAIEKWVEKNAPGIPVALAQCFAWRVTRNWD